MPAIRQRFQVKPTMDPSPLLHLLHGNVHHFTQTVAEPVRIAVHR
jgi:hypothetical protein